MFEPTLDDCTLGVLAKWPTPGLVKTRLAGETSPEFAASLAMACLRDTLDRLCKVSSRRVLAFAPPDAAKDFAAISEGRFALFQQAAGDLGQRMAAFFAAFLAQGAKRVVLVGGDSPTMPIEFVNNAFAALRTADVVIGPATDGGYYLIGCAGRLPPIFEGVAWGTSTVLADTIIRVKNADLKLELLAPWYDTDNFDDCNLLRGHIAAMRQAGTNPHVPSTEAVLQDATFRKKFTDLPSTPIGSALPPPRTPDH